MTIKHPSIIRERLLNLAVSELERLRIQLSTWAPDEVDVIRHLERPQQLDLADDLVNFVMKRLQQ